MTEGNFTDYVKITAASGNGGAGSMHLHREKFVPKGGPDGGDGGRGGHIILRGNKHLWTLIHFKFQKHFRAENGESGGSNRSFGANGKDIVLEVPLGTIVKDAFTDEFLFEITEDGQEVIALRGGKGGLGNWHFRSATNQTPRYAQPGLPGEERELLLELKVLADVGFVGFPNAGKSTLLLGNHLCQAQNRRLPFHDAEAQLRHCGEPRLPIVCSGRHSRHHRRSS